MYQYNSVILAELPTIFLDIPRVSLRFLHLLSDSRKLSFFSRKLLSFWTWLMHVNVL